MHMQVRKSRHHGLSCGVDDLCILWDAYATCRSGILDGFAANHHCGVFNRASAHSIDQPGMNDGDRLALTRVCTNRTQTSHQNKGHTSQSDLHFSLLSVE